MDDSVTGIVPTLAPHHDIGVGGKHVYDLPLPFVAPLRADQDRVGHDYLGKILSRCARSRHSGLASQNKSSDVRRKTILDTWRDNEVSEKKYAYHPIDYSGAVVNRRIADLAL